MNADEDPRLVWQGAVHDLNNVFETISDAAELLARDPRYSTLAAAIHRSVERGRGITGSLAGRAGARFDLDCILDNAIQYMRDAHGRQQAFALRFLRRVEPGIRLSGSAGEWERVFLNLFQNAVQEFQNAAQEMDREGLVKIEARRDGDCAEITVADNGPGIADNLLSLIFTPHFSTKASRTGLGLHIVERIVKQNGGEVTAGNQAGSTGGAFFRIRVPVA